MGNPVPAQMPVALPTRNTGVRHRLQVGRPVRAQSVSDLEIAAGHLAGARMFQAPASVRYALISSSGATFKRRIATPVLPEWAIVRAYFSAADQRTFQIRAASDTTGLTTWTDPVTVNVGGGDTAPFPADVLVEIGSGAIESPGYEEVHLDILNVASGTSAVRLHSWSVIPLPHLEPDSDGVF